MKVRIWMLSIGVLLVAFLLLAATPQLQMCPTPTPTPTRPNPVTITDFKASDGSDGTVILLTVMLCLVLFAFSWVIGRLHEARRQARGSEGESLVRLEALQQMNERCHELEKRLGERRVQ